MNSESEIEYKNIDEIKDKFLPIINITYQISMVEDINIEIKKLLDLASDYFQKFLAFFEKKANPYWYILNSAYSSDTAFTFSFDDSFIENIERTLNNLIESLKKIKEDEKIEDPEAIQYYLDYLRIPVHG